MGLLTKDPLTQLAFAIYENKGVYALLLGSGLSRAAEIPTGWEITLDLIRRIATAQGVVDQPDWVSWYRARTGKEPSYSALLEEVSSSAEERRSILNSYIEPTEQDREEGRKVPTAAHRAIAALVSSGYIRVIVTTNFDRLLENALREQGVEPTIISSPDALAGAQPITHSNCYLVKLHGDYKDARILNTETELAGYDKKYDALLDRIFDEYGLIIAGWSGVWDLALRSAFLRAPNRRYSVFWVARGLLGSEAEELVNHRRARVLSIADADTFFSSLNQRVETLAQSNRPNPLSIELLVGSTKRFLTKPEYRIQLDDLVDEEVGRLITQLDSDMFDTPNQYDQAIFCSLVKKYEAATEALVNIAGVLGRWGGGAEFPLVIGVIQSLYRRAGKLRNGMVWYLRLRSYPAVLIFSAYAIGLSRAERWSVLHELFDASIQKENREPERTVEALFLWWEGQQDDAWKQLEGLQKRIAPFADYLFESFSLWGKSFVGATSDVELVYEHFELLGALAYVENNEKESLRQRMDDRNSQSNWVWMPVGRLGWNHYHANLLISALEAEPLKSKVLNAGFCKGDPDILALSILNFRRLAGRRW